MKVLSIALRAATYDNQIRKWIKEDVAKAEEINEDTDLTELGKRLLNKCAFLCICSCSLQFHQRLNMPSMRGQISPSWASDC